PQTGNIVRVRSRQYLVEGVDLPTRPGDSTLLRLSCLEDDAQGEPLEVLWEREVDARLLHEADWDRIASRGFDAPRLFSAYLHTLRWGCVTSTDPKLFQAPYRAGIEVKAYQLEPLRLALGMPRVNLFIADDVGLGKTIEAGLIVRELLMRQKVRRVVICVPPSVVHQWRDEMEERFGLSFVVYDRDYVSRVRQERGYAVNPWKTHSRFILSHALVRDEGYAAPLRDWLGDFASGAMLILDEAHNVAPASGARYAIDSKLTRAMRDLAPRFEHKLFLSATPHNGHSNSFSSLLELLDPQKFCRGVPVDGRLRDTVMVRRLKSDLRALGEKFPNRDVVRVVIDRLPPDAPELELSRLLQDYRRLREARLASATKGQQASAMLVVTSLQKRLLSSIEAFARTLDVHRRSMQAQATKGPAVDARHLDLLHEAAGADDDRADLSEEEVGDEEDAQMEAATRQSAGEAAALGPELALLDRMADVARRARHLQDARVRHLVDWIRTNQCPNLGQPGAAWLPRRVLIFTEYADTKRYLEQQLAEALRGSDRDALRVATFHGGIGDERREAIKAAFNADPARHPLRILIATDAAREGVNLQNNCADLFHFDVPWNPGRLEQRNGRIDRKLQQADEVRCHYFVLPQRAEDRVLDVLVRKTRRIHEELGTLSPVIERRIDQTLTRGIEHHRVDALVETLDKVDDDTGEPVARVRTMKVEMGHEEGEARRQKLDRQLGELRGLLDRSRDWIGLDDRHFRDALSAALEVMGASGLTPANTSAAVADPSTARWVLPQLDLRRGADPSWAAALDALRAPRKRGQSLAEWRRDAPVRPVVFRDPGNLDGEVVHLHLEHRVVQRLLGRFVAQGFRDDDLRRATVLRTDDPVPRVVLLGRLSLFGDGGARLHDEVLAAAAAWVPPEQRRGGLKPLGETDKADVLRQVEEALASPRLRAGATLFDLPALDPLHARLKAHASADVAELTSHLERRAAVLTERAKRDLQRRAEAESAAMAGILTAQRDRIRARQKELDESGAQLSLGYDTDEERQLAADRKHWAARLAAIARELEAEPERVRRSYVVKAARVEPVGVVYLWPVSS
ncbi:MAG TPA: DISARM system SNF2-like helicase DrmD, partial [Myxococcota bacterium]|nr:DISARM system SNF2-like helicase DrmD [Myxococcota bacterium]